MIQHYRNFRKYPQVHSLKYNEKIWSLVSTIQEYFIMKQKRSKLKISTRFGSSYREGEYRVHRQKKLDVSKLWLSLSWYFDCTINPQIYRSVTTPSLPQYVWSRHTVTAVTYSCQPAHFLKEGEGLRIKALSYQITISLMW